MLEYVKNCERSMLASSVITLILGVVLVISPGGSIKMITSIIALLFMLIGGFQVVDYLRKSKEERMMSISLVLGIILLVIGIFLFINNEALISFITSIIGSTICLKSLFKIQFALNIRGMSSKWNYNLFAGLFGMLLGIILIVNPFSSAELFLRIIGLVLIIGSGLEIFETGVVMNSLNDYKELNYKEKKSEKEHEE